MDVAALAALLHETADHHGAFEAVAPPHDWWDWYAAYMDARERGSYLGRGRGGRRPLHGGGQAHRRPTGLTPRALRRRRRRRFVMGGRDVVPGSGGGLLPYRAFRWSSSEGHSHERTGRHPGSGHGRHADRQPAPQGAARRRDHRRRRERPPRLPAGPAVRAVRPGRSRGHRPAPTRAAPPGHRLPPVAPSTTSTSTPSGCTWPTGRRSTTTSWSWPPAPASSRRRPRG